MPGKGTKRTHSASRRHTRLFLAPVEAKKQSWGALSLLPQGFLETVIFSFLGISDKMKFFELNNELKKQLEGNASLKQALIKELLLTLVTAFQKPRSPYTSEQAKLLLQEFLKLTEANSLERKLALLVSNPYYVAGDESSNHDFITVLQEPHKKALAKAVLLALIRAHQRDAALFLLKAIPSFFTTSEDQLDYLLALMVSGNQIAAGDWIEKYPNLLVEKGRVVDLDGKIYEDITPYQYTLCLKHTQMRLMIRTRLSPEDAALQAKEFESRQHRDMQALRLKYEELMRKTLRAFWVYHERCPIWADTQRFDYWIRVVGGLQRQWPVHWMQELFYQRKFDENTNFKSASGLNALPRADFVHGEPFYPLNQGYVGATLYLMCYPKDELIENHELNYSPCLIKQEEEYFVFGPRPSGNLEDAVKRELIKLDVSSLSEILEKLPFTESISELCYAPAFRPLFDVADKALGGNAIGSGFSFSFAIANNQVNRFMEDARPFAWKVKANLDGLNRLDQVRSEELAEELKAVRQWLPKSEAEVRVHSLP